MDKLIRAVCIATMVLSLVVGGVTLTHNSAQSGGAGTAASIYRTTFANLASQSNGSVRYCTDCNANTSPCTSGGTGSFAYRVNGAWVCDTATSSTGGSGTTGTIAKFTSSTALGNSVITESSGHIGINKSPGSFDLDVNGLSNFGNKMIIAGPSGDWSSVVNGFNSAGNSFGIEINAGINSSDTAFVVNTTPPGTNEAFRVRGDGLINIAAGTPVGTGKMVISAAGLPTRSNNIALTGQGFPLIFGLTSQKSETGADANVLTVTPASAAGTYRISVAWSVTTATSAVIGWTATWKDSGGTAQAPTNLSMFQTGTAAPALTFTAATGSTYYAEAYVDVDNSGTNIVIKTTMGTGTLTASKLTAMVERIN